MTDWSTEPRTTQQWQDFIDAIKQRDVSVAKMDYEFDANIPDGVIRWNATASRFEIKNGASWDNLAAQFDMNVAQLEGNAASDFTPSSHVGSRGAQHANATQSESGFISSTDKFKLDSATAAATNNAIVQRDSSGRAKVSAPSAAEDIARKQEVDVVAGEIDTVSQNVDTVSGDLSDLEERLNNALIIGPLILF